MDSIKFQRILFLIAATMLIVMGNGTLALSAETITADATWQGSREIVGDLIIPEGITLTISGGSSIVFQPEPGNGKSPGTPGSLPKILVHGHLELEGDEGNPVTISSGDDKKKIGWAGIVVDDGNAWLREARINNARTGVYVKQGWVKLKQSIIKGNNCGVIIEGDSCGIKVEMSTITGNDFGLIIGSDAVVTTPESKIEGNSQKDIITGSEQLMVPDSCRIAMVQDAASKIKENPVQGTK